MNTLNCSVCQTQKPESDFFSNKKRKSGFDCYCKECRRIYSRKHYKMQTEYYENKNIRRKKKTRAYVVDFRTGMKCARCGFDNPAALDFHHLDPTQKEFSISQAHVRGIGLERIKKEIEKCIILCANCHRIEHSNIN